MHFCNFYIFFAIITLMTLEGFWNKVLTSLLYFILVHIISNCVSRSGLILQLGQVISVLIWRRCDVKPSWKNQSEKTVQSEEIGSNAVKIINLRKLFQIISGKYYFYIFNNKIFCLFYLCCISVTSDEIRKEGSPTVMTMNV